ncbi:6870_t:CDS:2, partial [Gigaspora rosea]
IAIGLDPVILLKDYKDPIREGYLSNKFLLNYNEKSEIKDLQDKYDYQLPISSIDSGSTKMIDGWLLAINKSIDNGNDPDKLGHTIDLIVLIMMDLKIMNRKQNIQPTSDQCIEKKPDVGKAVPKGLIGNISIAAKDLAFYRWHRLVDEKFNPRVFSDAPNVEIKPCNICFVFKNELVKVCPGHLVNFLMGYKLIIGLLKLG